MRHPLFLDKIGSHIIGSTYDHRLQMPINVHILQYKNMISIFRIFVGKIDVVCAWFFHKHNDVF